MARRSTPLFKQNPALGDKIMARLESTWQHLLARETATLRLTRKLAEGNTARLPSLPLRSMNVRCKPGAMGNKKAG